MSDTLFVGCDVSSKTNAICLMEKEGDELGYRNLPNTLSGAKKLESLLVKIMEENGFSTLKIGTEATSFLDLHLVGSF